MFNWTEPLIHTRLQELVEITQSFAPCHLSSNLNLTKADDELLLSKNPSFFRISLSVFNQAIYGETHKKGDIEIVKTNMVLLADAKKNVGCNTEIQVLYHRYGPRRAVYGQDLIGKLKENDIKISIEGKG